MPRRDQNHARITRPDSGAAMLTFVFALLVLGVAVFAGYRYYGPQVDLDRTQGTNTSVGDVETALKLYAARNAAMLPCPDLDGDGLENAGCTEAWGFLPWRTLGLSQSHAQDRWNGRLTYGARANGLDLCDGMGQLAPGALADNSGGTATVALISHGANRLGAFTPGLPPVQQTLPTVASELRNCRNLAGTACPGSAAGALGFQSRANTADFDDVVSTIPNFSSISCYCARASLTAEAPAVLASGAINVTVPTTGSVTVQVKLAPTISPPKCPLSLTAAWTPSDTKISATVTRSDTGAVVTGNAVTYSVGADDVNGLVLAFTIPGRTVDPAAEAANKTISVTYQVDPAMGADYDTTASTVTLRLAYTAATTSHPVTGTANTIDRKCQTEGTRKMSGNAKGADCEAPEGETAGKYWANKDYDDRLADLTARMSLYSYFDLTDPAKPPPGSNSPTITTTKSKANNESHNSATMDVDLATGSAGYTARPLGLGPWQNTDKIRYQKPELNYAWFEEYLNSGSAAGIQHVIGFMGKGTTAFDQPIFLDFGQTYYGLFIGIMFEPDYGGGSILRPSAVGLRFWKGNTKLGVIYRCYADAWKTTGSVQGADQLFAASATGNWCTGRANDDSANQFNPMYNYIYVYNTGFTAVEIFPVSNSKFFVGAIGLDVN